MELWQGQHRNSVCSFVAVIAMCCLSNSALAQAITPPELPGGVTPGGALPYLDKIPKLEPREQPDAPAVQPESLPTVPESGVRMQVRAFVLEGVVDHPEHGINREELERKVEEIRADHARGFTISELQEITNELTFIYRKAGYILSRAYIPEQEVNDGRVVIRILEGQLEQVSFANNKRYSEKTLNRPFEGLVGQPVHQEGVERALLELNDYPGLRFNSVFSPGDTVGTAKLGINVEEEKWAQGTLWFDNHGTEYTGEYRLWADAALNNLTGAADRLSAQVLTTFGDNDGKSNFYALSYQRPVFSPRYLFGMGASKNNFDVGGDFAELGLQGESSTISTSLRRNFIRSRDMNVDGSMALAMKESSTDINTLAIGDDALTVLTLSPVIDFRDNWAGYTQIGLTYSLGLADVLGSMDSNGDHKSSRTGGSGERAGGDFSKLNLQFARWQPLLFMDILKNTSLLIRLDWQYTDDLLVSMEQMPLGGPNSVRAYPPSERMVDKGQFLSLEWIAKSSEASKGTILENLQFSAFYDYASGDLNDPLPNDIKAPELQGIGGSVQIAPQGGTYLARLELAMPLGDPDPSNERDVQYFFRLGYMF